MHRARRIGTLALIAVALAMPLGLAPVATSGAASVSGMTATSGERAVSGTAAVSSEAASSGVAAVSGEAAVSAASPPSAVHPYSDPIWSPLRNPARVSCVRTNCPGPYHGYWAIDFLGLGHVPDPLYAAGAGVFHIGAVMGKDTCSTIVNGGTWAWIDHGGGRTTRYLHLYKVFAKEGALVTPATIIGTMGHNGNRAPCRVNYLHMEYRVHGKTGPRMSPPAMLACTNSGRVSMPSQGLGSSFAQWDLVPNNGVSTPAATNACLGTSRGASTPTRPVVSGRPGPASATIRWGVVPADVGHTVVTIETWHPSLARYGNPEYRVVTGRASSTRFTGLLNGRPYRLRAATHNGAGYSAWTSHVKVVPAAVPSAPRAPRKLTTTRDSIRYAWWLPASNGSAIKRSVVARRCLAGGTWTTWATTNVAGVVRGTWTLHYNWTGMPRGRTCQVKVRAVNSVGYGPWSRVSRATTLQ